MTNSETSADGPTAAVMTVEVLKGSMEGGWDGEDSMLSTGGSADKSCWLGMVEDGVDVEGSTLGTGGRLGRVSWSSTTREVTCREGEDGHDTVGSETAWGTDEGLPNGVKVGPSVVEGPGGGAVMKLDLMDSMSW